MAETIRAVPESWCDLLNVGVRWHARAPLAVMADDDAGSFRS